MKIRANDKALDRFLERVSSDDMFMASTLSSYCSSNKMTQEQLCKQLECTHEELIQLALCRRPRPNTDVFKREVEQVTRHTSVKPILLVRLLREVAALESLRGVSEIGDSGHGFLAAARDRDETEADEGPEE
ncbi:MAG TPA: hypothetical protein V6C81_25900 [Planktothrix sp.]